MSDPNGITGADDTQGSAHAVGDPVDASGAVSDAGWSWLVVNESDLEALSLGTVPPEVQAQAVRLREDITVMLERNAARVSTSDKRGKKQIGKPLVSTRGRV